MSTHTPEIGEQGVRTRLLPAMALFDLMVTVLLFLNALAILNEERFLSKRACRVAPTLRLLALYQAALAPSRLARKQ